MLVITTPLASFFLHKANNIFVILLGIHCPRTQSLKNTAADGLTERNMVKEPSSLGGTSLVLFTDTGQMGN
jgi:hypothetical protein